jgi:hypothetical protein
MVDEKQSFRIIGRKIVSVLLSFNFVLFLNVLSVFSQENSNHQNEKVDFQSVSRKKENTENIVSAFNDFLTNDPNALKMKVRGRGVYRIDAQSLTEHGFDSSQAANWRLFANGIEQPIIVNADGSIEFYGVGVDTTQTDPMFIG